MPKKCHVLFEWPLGEKASSISSLLEVLFFIGIEITNKSLTYIYFLKHFFWCAPFGYLYFLYFQIVNEPGLGAGIGPGMGLTPFPSSIVLDKIQTHDLPIVSRVR